jgi:hypothetical protein
MLFFTGCGSSTVIRTEPSGAKVYIDGELVGITPYDYYDTKIVGARTQLRFVLDGYEEYQVSLVRNEQVDVGAVVASLFFFPVPLLWIMKYKPAHTYELTPLLPEKENALSKEVENKRVEDRVARLSQLKNLWDNGALTKEEFEAEKKKILAE